MTNRRWLKREVPLWVKEELITKDAGKEILSRYKNEEKGAYKEAFFVMAMVCILGGLGFFGASLWATLSQDQRFLLALAPLLFSLALVVLVVLYDRRIPDDPVMKKGPLTSFSADEEVSELSDSGVSADAAKRIGRKAQVFSALMGESHLVSPGTWHHRLPVFLRESVAAFHSICLLCAFWMVSDSFKLSDDMYGGLALCALLLLLVTLVTSSAASGMIYMAVSVGIFYTAPARGWPEFASWIFMILALFMLGHMLHERRDRAVVCFSWGWAVGILLLIFWSAGDMLWQTMFFSLAAALTWMAGGAFRSYGIGAAALRFFGGIAVFAVLLEGSYGAVWADMSGSYALWILYFLFLVVDALLLFRMAMKKEWLSVLAGLTPFVMAMAAVISVFETSGALPAMVVSLYCAILAIGVIARGFQTDRQVQRWGGVALLAGNGVIRVMDSALTLVERGAFFLAVGLFAALVCYLLYKMGAGKPKKKRPEPVETEKEETQDAE